MERREFLISTTAGLAVAATSAWAQTPRRDPAKAARIAIMTLSFNPILKSANFDEAPERTLDLMDIGQVLADRWAVHNVELQHSHLPSTEEAWLKDFKARLAKSKSQVSNINLEFGPLNISAPQLTARLQAIDLTKQWIDHAVVLGSPRIMINQGAPTEENKQITIETLKAMGDYAKSKGVKVGMENRGAVSPEVLGLRGRAGEPPPPPPPPALAPLLVEVIKGAGTYANCDIGNFNDQAAQHAGMRLMLPLTDGNTHVKLRPDRFDLPTALKLAKEFGYTGLFSIEANANMAPAMGPDPYANVQKVYDVIVANI
jgi:sugar phosphate isomerase/epimerase